MSLATRATRATLLALAGLSAANASCSRIRELAGRDPANDPSSAASAPPAPDGALPAFPGAEGFGAATRGGRGGPACRVKTLAHAGPGSLQACLDAIGPRIVVFDVSGVIEGPLEVKHGRLTIAGQTAPGGITIKGGLVCDNVYDPNDCNDLIVRHVRFRGGAPDSLRLGGAHDVIVDHCSMAAAEDENLELTRSRNVTIQRSILAEPTGDHYQWGGLLINYSKDVLPLDRITIHHTVWNGVAGRLPEISCEENGDGPGKSNCAGHVLNIELANNVLWDAADPIWFNHCTGNNEGNDCPTATRTFALSLNLVGNVMARRASADADAPLVEAAVYTHRGGSVHSADNLLLRGTVAAPANGSGKSAPRHPFPAVTYTPASAVVELLARTAGPWPRDRMDQRLASYLVQPIDARPAAWRSGRGVDAGDAVTPGGPSAAPPLDSDGDGVPDDWEIRHGRDPRNADDAALGSARGCNAGYSALECYVNELADARVPR